MALRAPLRHRELLFYLNPFPRNKFRLPHYNQIDLFKLGFLRATQSSNAIEQFRYPVLDSSPFQSWADRQPLPRFTGVLRPLRMYCSAQSIPAKIIQAKRVISWVLRRRVKGVVRLVARSVVCELAYVIARSNSLLSGG